jgi:DNA-binding MarR family transcriptional regulator
VTTRAKEEQIKRIHDNFILLMRVVKRWFVQELQSFNLTVPQFITLAALAAHRQPCPMSDLTNVTFVDAPTMTGVIDRLVRMRLVQRTRSEMDRRVVLVRATQPGIELIGQIEQSLMQRMLVGYAQLSDEELTSYEHLLRRLLRIHLGQYMSLQDADLDAEIEKLEQFMRDPITYTKLENEKTEKRWESGD